MALINLLYKDRIAINDRISVMIPSVGKILEDEENYYRLVSILTSVPYDMMVQLDDIGIDFTTINDYELFLLLFQGLKEEDTSLLFGDLQMTKFETVVRPENGTIALRDPETGIIIDRAIYSKIADAIRTIHHLEKTIKKPGNDQAKEYLIERARKKMKRRKSHQNSSELESLITAMVNTSEFKYDYESVKNLSIYQFNESVHQIIRKTDWDNRMHGIYAGTVDAKRLSEHDLSWFSRQ